MRAIDLTGQKFGRLTVLYKTNKRCGHSIVWHCICQCGQETDVGSAELRKGTTKSCGCLRKQNAKKMFKKYGEENAEKLKNFRQKDITNQRFGKLVALQIQEVKNHKTIWKCKCDCGNICYVNIGDLNTGNTSSCGCLRSKGEAKVRELLSQQQIPFCSQKIFEDCVFPNTGGHPRFDFYVNDQYLIEYDGIQHFSYSNNSWNNEEYFKKTQERDAFKNEWCKKNNIPLIRIPYTKLKTLEINDLLLETTSFLIK